MGRQEALVYSPIIEELTCGDCSELRTIIRRTLVWDAKCSNVHRKQSIRPLDPACACSMMGQFEYLSTTKGSLYPCSGKKQQIYTGRDVLAGLEGRVGH